MLGADLPTSRISGRYMHGLPCFEYSHKTTGRQWEADSAHQPRLRIIMGTSATLTSFSDNEFVLLGYVPPKEQTWRQVKHARKYW